MRIPAPTRRQSGAPRVRPRAFTILEVMIAIFIFGLVLVAIYSTWLAILKGSKVSLDAAAAVQRSRIALRALEDALLTAQLYNANIRYYAFIGDKESMSLVSRLPASFPGVGRYGDQIVRRVSFYLQPGKDGMQELMMTQVPMLLDTKDAQVEPYTIALAKDVAVFELQYWDMQKKDWVDVWTLTNTLPKLVQVTLGMGRVGTSTRPQDVVARIVAVPANAVTPDILMPFAAPGLRPGQTNQPLPGGVPGQQFPPGTTYPPGTYPPGGPYPLGVNPAIRPTIPR